MANFSRWSLLVLLLAAGPTLADKRIYDDVEVIADSDPQGESTHGYTEWRVQVKNRGDQPRRVTLQIPGVVYGMRGGISAIRRSVEVGPGQTAMVSLFQPAMPQVMGQDLLVTINGSKQEPMLSLRPASSPSHSYGFPYRRMYRVYSTSSPSSSDRLVLSSQRIDEKFFQVPGIRHLGGGFGGGAADGILHPLPPDEADPGVGVPGGAEIGPGPGMAGAGGVGGPVPITWAFDAQFQRSPLPISLWSPNWLGYTRYDLIAVTREDIDELLKGTPETRAVLSALWQYTEAGGSLLVLGPGTIPLPSAWSESHKTIEGVSFYQVGFGTCMLTSDRAREKWTPNLWSEINGATSATSTPWRSSRSVIDLHNSFPIVDDVSVPIRGLFALMILFGLAIGPVNLIVLSRKKRRIWLLWTVPLLSGVFCFLVMGYVIVAEGWVGHVRLAGFTILNEIDRTATTLGKTGFYSPLTPGDGLRFSSDTEVLMQGSEHPATYNNCVIDWTGEQHLSRGWVTARVPAYFMLRKSELRRERITLRKEGDKLVVINALGADVKTLTLADANGELYTAGPIAAGERVTLTRLNQARRRARPIEKWGQLYSGRDWALAIEGAVKQPAELLGPSTYLAVLEETPFLENGLKSARLRPTDSVVLGIMANEN